MEGAPRIYDTMETSLSNVKAEPLVDYQEEIPIFHQQNRDMNFLVKKETDTVDSTDELDLTGIAHQFSDNTTDQQIKQELLEFDLEYSVPSTCARPKHEGIGISVLPVDLSHTDDKERSARTIKSESNTSDAADGSVSFIYGKGGKYKVHFTPGLRLSDNVKTEKEDTLILPDRPVPVTMFKADKEAKATLKRSNGSKVPDNGSISERQFQSELREMADSVNGANDSIHDPLLVTIPGKLGESANDICSFKNSVALQGETPAGEKPYKCSLCDFSSHDENTLAMHMRLHTDKPQVCVLCGYRSNMKLHLIAHMKKHAGERLYKCVICDYRSVNKFTVRDHMGEHTTEGLHKCTFCDYSCTQEHLLIAHRKQHTGYKCSLCEYICPKEYLLIAHARKHSGGIPYKCSLCDYSSYQKDHLEAHRRTHAGKRPFKCSLCEFSTMQKHCLNMHRRRHTGERPYKCSICDYSCIRERNLALHMRTHTGERPYQCSICDYTATRKENFTAHMRKHSSERPHKCSHCDKTFRYRKQLSRHMKNI